MSAVLGLAFRAAVLGNVWEMQPPDSSGKSNDIDVLTVSES